MYTGVIVRIGVNFGGQKCICSNYEKRTYMAKSLGSVLFVSRLSFYTTNQELNRLFSPFGVVKEARLVKDQRTQRPKGFGFVTFESEIEAQNALKAMNDRIVGGRLIFVEVAETTRPEDNDVKIAKP